MLILSRRRSEVVVLGAADACNHLIKITLLEMTGGTVRLGSEAEASVPVHRLEVWERMRAGVPAKGPRSVP